MPAQGRKLLRKRFKRHQCALRYAEGFDKSKNRVLVGTSVSGKTFTVEVQPY